MKLNGNFLHIYLRILHITNAYNHPPFDIVLRVYFLLNQCSLHHCHQVAHCNRHHSLHRQVPLVFAWQSLIPLRVFYAIWFFYFETIPVEIKIANLLVNLVSYGVIIFNIKQRIKGRKCANRTILLTNPRTNRHYFNSVK